MDEQRMSTRVRIDHIRQAIAHCHPVRKWIVLDEFPLDVGKRSTGTPRIDSLAVRYIPPPKQPRPVTREAYEIKIDRQDFLRELKNAEKREKAYAVCDRYWFIVPHGLVEAKEVPPECGLMWVPFPSGYPIVMKLPVTLKTKPPSREFMMDVARRAYQIGRRDGATTCALERFDVLISLVQMLFDNDPSRDERMAMIKTVAGTLTEMQRHAEARELLRVASGETPLSWGMLPRLHTSAGRVGR